MTDWKHSRLGRFLHEHRMQQFPRAVELNESGRGASTDTLVKLLPGASLAKTASKQRLLFHGIPDGVPGSPGANTQS
jgi:hypothetical protein